jgi:hypothetical protein
MGCRGSLFFVKFTFVYVEFSKFGIRFSKKSLFLAKKRTFREHKIIFGIAPISVSVIFKKYSLLVRDI